MEEVKAYRKKTGSKNWMGLMLKEVELWIERVSLAFKSRNVISVPFKGPLKASDDFFCFTIPRSQTEISFLAGGNSHTLILFFFLGIVNKFA